MKYFLGKLILLLPIPLFVAGTNYFVDPAQLYNDRYAYGVARLLIKGNNVANVSNYDERLMQKYYIEGLEKGKDVIVIGSSRSKQIGSEIFCNDSFFNNGVSGASLEDYMAIYRTYRSKNLIPSRIIIGLDPWILNINNRQRRWKSIRIDYEALLRQLSPNENINEVKYPKVTPDKYYELLSPSYFQASVKKFIRNRDEYYITTDSLPDDGMVRNDGLWVYPREHRLREMSEVQAKVIEQISSKEFYSLGDFYAFDLCTRQKMEAFNFT